MYMRLNSEHGMGLNWAPQDLPAAGPRRYGHSHARKHTRETIGGERDSGDIFLAKLGN